jgi:hypothetical protein
LLVALLVGPRVVGVLLGIVAPPVPPLPQNVSELAYTSEAHGVDHWVYRSDDDFCHLVEFYQTRATTCPVIPRECGGSGTTHPDLLAACYGDVDFSIFAMRWTFEVPVRTVGGQGLRFELARDVSWLGALPPEPLDSPYRNG